MFALNPAPKAVLAPLRCHDNVPRVLIPPPFHARALQLVRTNGTVMVGQIVPRMPLAAHCPTLTRQECVRQARGVEGERPNTAGNADIPVIDAARRCDWEIAVEVAGGGRGLAWR